MTLSPNWKSEQRRKDARKLLVHYLTLDRELSGDCYTEIGCIVDDIFDEIDDANARAARLSERISELEATARDALPLDAPERKE